MTAGGLDVASALWTTAGFLGVLAVIVAFILWRAKRNGSRSAVLELVLTLSTWFIVITLFMLVIGVITTFSNSWIQFTTTAVGPYSMPAECGSLEDAGSAEPALYCLSFDRALVTISSPSAAMRWMAAAGQILSTVAFLTPFAIIAIVSFQAAAGRPFHALTTRSMYVGAVVVAVAGLGSDAVTSLGQTAALREMLTPGDIGYPQAFYMHSSLWPLGAALLLAALAAIFRHGARLQRDTEGLV